MGKVKGFMEYQRALPADREPLERIKDWQEFHKEMAPDELQKQGARLYGLRDTVLPYRVYAERYDERLPDPQSYSRVERLYL